jgi:hypothetical protein
VVDQEELPLYLF